MGFSMAGNSCEKIVNLQVFHFSEFLCRRNRSQIHIGPVDFLHSPTVGGSSLSQLQSHRAAQLSREFPRALSRSSSALLIHAVQQTRSLLGPVVGDVMSLFLCFVGRKQHPNCPGSNSTTCSASGAHCWANHCSCIHFIERFFGLHAICVELDDFHFFCKNFIQELFNASTSSSNEQLQKMSVRSRFEYRCHMESQSFINDIQDQEVNLRDQMFPATSINRNDHSRSQTSNSGSWSSWFLSSKSPADGTPGKLNMSQNFCLRIILFENLRKPLLQMITNVVR